MTLPQPASVSSLFYANQSNATSIATSNVSVAGNVTCLTVTSSNAIMSAGNVIAAGGYVPLSALSNSISLATLPGVPPASAFATSSIPLSALSNFSLATIGGVLPVSAFSNVSIPSSAVSLGSTFANVTVTNTLTLGSNVTNVGSSSTNQITAQTWNYMQNYVYSMDQSRPWVPTEMVSWVTALRSTA